VIAATLIEQFRRDGFVAVRGLLSPDEIARFGAAVDHAVATRKRRDTRTLAEKTPYEQSFIQGQSIWEDFPETRGLTFHQKIAGTAARLLGAERVRLWHDQALYKEAGGRETEAHQDHGYWPIAEADAVTAWIPLMDVNHETGCMGYVAGTHTGDCEFVDIFRNPGAGKAFERRYGAPVYVTAEAGDVLFHHGHTVHMAKANASAHMRRIHTAIYFRDGCTRSSDKPHPSVDRDDIAVGAAIGGGATPIAFPLPEGHLPDPAPWPDSANTLMRRAHEMGIFPQRLS
jgi:ectoine hydroxylase-related dioxygenase (phytanoyl-CoA dioxygenase family)